MTENILRKPLSRRNKVQIAGFFDEPVRDRLKALAVEQKTTIQALLTEGLNHVFEKHGKPQISSIEPGEGI